MRARPMLFVIVAGLWGGGCLCSSHPLEGRWESDYKIGDKRDGYTFDEEEGDVIRGSATFYSFVGGELIGCDGESEAHESDERVYRVDVEFTGGGECKDFAHLATKCKLSEDETELECEKLGLFLKIED